MDIFLHPLHTQTVSKRLLSESNPSGAMTIVEMATDGIITQAYEWLCHQRKERSHNNCVWDLRHHWERLKPELQDRVIKLTHQILNRLKLKMHPDKTYLGWIKKGFDFLGVHFGDTPTISKTSLENHRTKLAQRYAQGASDACIGNYIARWTSWCTGVLKRWSKSNQITNSMGTGATEHPPHGTTQGAT
jgi:hypothetical protein